MTHPSRAKLSGGVLLVPVLVAFALAAFAWPAANLAPRDLDLGLVGPAPIAARMSDQLNAHAPGAFALHTYADADAARAAIKSRDIYGAIVVAPSGTTLYIASADSALVAQLLTQELLPALASAQPNSLPAPSVVDVVPGSAKDPHGLVLGAAVLPLVLAGMLAGILIALLSRAGLVQIAALAAAAILAGLAADAIAQGWLGALDGNWLANTCVFTLTIFAIASAMAGLGALLGAAGLGLGALLMVFVGNPFSGIATSPALLPAWVRVTGQLLPPGAGGNLLRSTAFFGGAGGGGSLAVLSAWIVFGLAAVALAALRQHVLYPRLLAAKPN
jgi:hypothetical protein